MDNYKLAKKKVKKKKGFYQHFSVYLAVIGFLAFINFATEPWDIWFIFPAASWGIAIVIHYLNVFGFPFTKGIMTPEWEEREIEKEMEKLDLQNPPRQRTAPPEMNEELELKEFKKLRSEWDDQEFV